MNQQANPGGSHGFAETSAGGGLARSGAGAGSDQGQQALTGTGTWVLNLVTDELTLSPRTRAVLGVGEDERFDMADFFAALHPDDLDATSTAFALTTHPRVQAVYDVTYRIVGRADGIVRWVAARGVGLFDREGFCVRAVGTASGLADRPAAAWPADPPETAGGLATDDPGLSAINDCIDEAMANPEAGGARARLDYRWFEYMGQHARPLKLATWPTPKPQRQQAMLRTENSRERAWNALPDLLCTLTPDGSFRCVNATWTKQLGWRPEDLLDHDFLVFSHPADRDAIAAAMARAVSAHLPGHEGRMLHEDGGQIWVAWSFSSDGASLFASGRDVTAERQAAEASARSEALLRQDQKMQAVAQLARGIAHEFNNLLQALSGGLELLERRHVASDAGRHLISRANAAVERGSLLTKQLLGFSGKQHLAPQIVDLNAVIANAAGLRDGLVDGIDIVWALEPHLWAAVADPSQLAIAVLNLLLNARDATPGGGTIEVATANVAADGAVPGELTPGDYVSLVVKDAGCGMTDAVMLRAIEPFFTTKGLGGGSGLGLSQAYGFARQSGGTLRLASAPGRGSTVQILLPRALPAIAARPAAPPEPLPRLKTILVVDDDQDVRELTVAALEECGYQVLEADGGVSGLERLGEAAVDLMLVDFAMPGMTGAEMVRLARQRFPDIGVLFMTGYADLDALREYAAPEDIIRKPFRLATLTDHVAAVTGR